MKLISSLVAAKALFIVSAPIDSSSCGVQGVTLSSSRWFPKPFRRGSGEHQLLLEEPLLGNSSGKENESNGNTSDPAVIGDLNTEYDDSNMRNVLYLLNKGMEIHKDGHVLKLEKEKRTAIQRSFLATSIFEYDVPKIVLYDNLHKKNVLWSMEIANVGDVRSEQDQFILSSRYCELEEFSFTIKLTEENKKNLLNGIISIVNAFHEAGSTRCFIDIWNKIIRQERERRQKK